MSSDGYYYIPLLRGCGPNAYRQTTFSGNQVLPQAALHACSVHSDAASHQDSAHVPSTRCRRYQILLPRPLLRCTTVQNSFLSPKGALPDRHRYTTKVRPYPCVPTLDTSYPRTRVKTLAADPRTHLSP